MRHFRKETMPMPRNHLEDKWEADKCVKQTPSLESHPLNKRKPSASLARIGMTFGKVISEHRFFPTGGKIKRPITLPHVSILDRKD